jgi:hypothetical protein
LGVHTPPEQKLELLRQSLSLMHGGRQAVALAHLTPPGQGAVDEVHAPEPLQALVVSSPLLQDGAAHTVPMTGKTHAPMPSQDVAPHTTPMGEQAAVQHAPTPVVPQTLLAH